MNVIQRRTLYHNFITLIIVGVAFVLPFLYMGSYRVEAAANPSIRLQISIGSLSPVIDSCNKEFRRVTESSNNWFKHSKGSDGIDGGDNWRIVTMNMSVYTDLDAEQKKAAMSAVLTTISKSTLPQNTRLRLYNFVAEQDESVSSLVRQLSNDVNADFATAYSWFKPFSGTVSTVLGFLAIIIFVALGLMIVIDLAYLVIPPFRSAIEKTDGSKPNWVSNEAYKATLEVEKGDSKSKSTLWVYFKSKAVQLVILAICLLYLIQGKIYSLVAWIIDTFNGVIG